MINMRPIVKKTSHLTVIALSSCLLWSCAIENAATNGRPAGDQTPQVTSSFQWDGDFEVVDIPSSADREIQKAYFHASESAQPQPLLVHLHTWSNDYSKADVLAKMVRDRGWNYIHPDFRGRNNTPQSSCSELAIQDIDDAIAYALRKSNVDTSRIYVAG